MKTTPSTEPMTFRELAFIREVLIPRAWVHGAEVDELVRLKAKISRIFKGLTAEGDRRELAQPKGQEGIREGRKE